MRSSLVPKATLIHSVHQLSAPCRPGHKLDPTTHETTGPQFQNKTPAHCHIFLNHATVMPNPQTGVDKTPDFIHSLLR